MFNHSNNLKKMIIITIFALIMCILITGNTMLFSYSLVLPGQSLVRVYYTDDLMKDKIGYTLEHGLLESDYTAGYHFMRLTADEIALLSSLGQTVEYRPLTDIEHLQAMRTPDGRAGIPGYPCYRLVEETFADIEKIVEAHPDLATIVDAGDSWEKVNGMGGYDHLVLVLTNKNITGTPEKPKLLITSTIHAREYTTAELNMRFAEYLIDNYGKDPDITWLLDYHEAHMLLYANPDGRKKAETGLMWRKTTNQNYCGATSNSRGCDLNRNFDSNWGSAGSSDQCSETYRGASAASEPETQAVQNYIKKIFTDYNGNNPDQGAPDDAMGVYIDLHSYGEIMLGNTGGVNGTQNKNLVSKFGYFNNYTKRSYDELALTDSRAAMTFNYAYTELGIAAVLFELGTAFFERCSYFEDSILDKNIQALLYALRVARAPYMESFGPDALTLTVSQDDITAGIPVTLNARIDDTRYGDSTVAQNIASAVYYIDTPPWLPGASAVPMGATDGAFDAKIESVAAVIDTLGLAQGRHIIYVRGTDVSGNTGPVSAIFLTVKDGVTPTPTPTATPVLKNVALHKPVTVSGIFSAAYPATAVNDGDPGTAWGSRYNQGNQWVFIDLEKVTDIKQVVVRFINPYYSPYYHIGVSNDAITWEFAATVSNGNGGVDTTNLDTSARYIGLLLTKGPKQVYGISELEVYAPVFMQTPTPTMTPTPTATPTPDLNIIKNGDFSDGLANWTPYIDAGAAGNITVVDGTASITIDSAGTQNWHIQLLQNDITYSKGRTYTISFKARATGSRTMTVIAGMSSDPYIPYGEKTVTLGTTMQTYTFTLTMTYETDNTAVLEFDCGMGTEDIFIDDVSLLE